MKRLLVSAVLSVAALLGLTLQSQAHGGGGLFRGHRGGCDSGCGVSVSCAPVAPVAPAPVQYVEQKVTRYKQVFTEKLVDVVVCKPVTRQENFVYEVRVPVMTPQKRQVTVYTSVQKQVPYTYSVCVPVTVAEKRMQTFFTSVQKEVAYNYTAMVPKTVQKTIKVTSYQCVTENVTEMRQVCRLVRVQCVDACGNCVTSCQRVTETVPVTRCVVKRIPTVQDVVVNQTICEAVPMTGKKIVCELVPNTREVVVNVCRIEMKQMTGTRTVCEMVPSVQEVVVNVCSFNVE
jgi:hypothetical protein